MPRKKSADSDLRSVVEDFVGRLASAIEAATTQRVHAAVLQAVGVTVPRGPGRPRKNPVSAFAAPAKAPTAAPVAAPAKPAKKRAPHKKQLCPVPGCKNPAAPVFGMVCADHKGVAKSKIKQYREERRAKKDK